MTPIPTPFAYEGLFYINGGRGRPLFAIRPGAAGDISLKEGQTQTSMWSGRSRAVELTCRRRRLSGLHLHAD